MNSSREVQGSHAAAAMIGASRRLKLQSSVHIKKWLPASSLVDGGTLLGNGANVKHIGSTFGKAKKHQLQIWENVSSRYWWNWVFWHFGKVSTWLAPYSDCQRSTVAKLQQRFFLMVQLSFALSSSNNRLCNKRLKSY